MSHYMLARLLLAGALVAGAPSPDADLGALVDEAVELLDRELILVPLAAPANSESATYETTRAELGAVERAGEAVLGELRASGVELSTAIEETLSGPGPAGSPVRRPPAPAVYATAKADLRALVGDGSTASPSSGEASAAPGAVPDASGDAAPGASPDASSGGSPEALPDTSADASSDASPDALDASSDASPAASGLPIPVAGTVIAAVVGGAWFALRRRKRHLDEAIDQATIDPLTSVPNRRRLESDIDASSRDLRRRVSVLMVDIDHFKQVNDVHGHQAGDAVLRRVGEVLPAAVRAGDVVYRYGGEEFCVLLPDASVVEAQAVAERVRRAVGVVQVPGGESITASVGVAEGAAASTRASIARADRALYDAKRSGRDRIAISS